MDDQWLGAHTDPGGNGWANATFFRGLLVLPHLTGSPRYLAYARGWAEKHARARAQRRSDHTSAE